MPDFAFAPTENLADLGTAAGKYNQNLAAIRILKDCEAAARAATRHEQEILARYTGWGDGELLRRAFPHGAQHTQAQPAAELQELLTEDELAALRASSLNAHYTSLPVIRAIYAGLLHLGLQQPAGKEKLRVLEPAAGVGHFIGAMPAELQAHSRWAAVELDPLSARITKLLYPATQVYAEGFETANLPPNWFDLVSSNVPFGNYRVFDPTMRVGLSARLHPLLFLCQSPARDPARRRYHVYHLALHAGQTGQPFAGAFGNSRGTAGGGAFAQQRFHRQRRHARRHRFAHLAKAAPTRPVRRKPGRLAGSG